MSFPLGKIEPSILQEVVFKYLGAKRNDVIFGPSYGEDAAIVRVGDSLLAVSCDPISGAERRIGWLAVNVSANDVSTRGIRPRWFLPCVMLPEGSGKPLLEEICVQMDKAAQKLGVAIVGGHSEVTPGISHPLVIGFCAGVADEDRYVACAGAKPGCKIVMTKGAGIEGTAVLAADRRRPLEDEFGEEFVARAESYFDSISVVEEAISAFRYGGVLAMHDPTEGGISGGLNEMAEASGTGFEVYESQIYVSKETSEICRYFRIEPLNLIGSGSLLIAATPERAKGVVSEIESLGIRASIVGEFLADKSIRRIVKRDGSICPLVMPEFDDLWVALKRRV